MTRAVDVQRASTAPVVLSVDREQAKAVLTRAIARWNRGVSPRTELARMTDLRLFGATFDPDAREPWEWALVLIGSNDPDDADTKAQLWLDAMTREGLTNTTRARRISTLRSLCKSLRTNREIRLRWELAVKPPKFDPYNNATGAPIESVRAAIAELVEDGPLHELLAVLLMFDLGLRLGEALALSVGDWEPTRGNDGVIRVVRKGGAETRRSATARVRDVIERRIAELGSPPDSDALLVGVSDTTIRQRCHGLGIGNPHGLRHTGATELYRLTRDLALVQQHLGHRNIATTQVYLDQVEDAAGRASRILSGEQDADDHE